MLILVNLYGAPGSGKSTGASYIFSKLKMKGINAELITEFAKDKVWEESIKPLQNQIYVFGQQYFRTSRLDGKVDVAITDSPLLLSIIYNQNKEQFGDEFDSLVFKVALSYKDRLDYLIKRTKPYKTSGRLESEKESDDKFNQIKALLDSSKIEYSQINGEQQDYDAIVDDIINKIFLKEETIEEFKNKIQSLRRM